MNSHLLTTTPEKREGLHSEERVSVPVLAVNGSSKHFCLLSWNSSESLFTVTMFLFPVLFSFVMSLCLSGFSCFTELMTYLGLGGGLLVVWSDFVIFLAT